MSGDTVTVHRLRVAAPRFAAAQGVGDRLAEALRIASKPPALANRFVLIRRLRLSVPPGASAQTIALLIEREWQRVLGSAVFIGEAGASAEVVWAPCEGEARLALLTRWLNDEDDSAWFWQRLVPAPSSLPLVECIAALLIEPLAEAVAPLAATMAWQRECVAALLRHGQLAAVLAVLPQAQRLSLQGLAEALQRGDDQEPPRREPRPTDAAGPGSVHAARERAPPPAVTLSPAVATTRPVEGIAEAEAETALRAAVLAGEGALPAVVAAAVSARTTAAGAPTDEAEAPGPSPAQPRSDDGPVPVVAACRAQSVSLPGQATAWAGLWLLVPVLLRQGFAAAPLAPGDPRSRHSAAVFAALVYGLRQRYRLDAVACEWIDAQLCTEAAQLEAQAWWLKVRRACVRDARLPLLRLLRRPGELLLSDHRIDIVMPLRTLDIRLRRAGFDIDPGYLPWLDAVLRFHYA